MKKVLLALMLLAFFVPVMAQENGEAAKVMALENVWNQAEMQQDTHAIESLMTADFVLTTFDGTVQNKAQYIASVKDKDYHPQILASSNMKIHLYGNTAIVTGDYREKGLEKDKPFEHKGRLTDTWINQGGKWVCASSALTLVAPK
jgi:ketosteroid isomerase-like protein